MHIPNILTFCLTIATALQLEHASDQHCGGDSRLDETSCQSQRYGHLKQPAGQMALSIIGAYLDQVSKAVLGIDGG